jgi:hypothetical protein
MNNDKEVQCETKALALGARTGVVMTLTTSAAKMASKEAVNLVSRSRMRNLDRGRLVGGVHREVASLLGDPAGGRVRRDRLGRLIHEYRPIA